LRHPTHTHTHTRVYNFAAICLLPISVAAGVQDMYHSESQIVGSKPARKIDLIPQHALMFRCSV